MTTSKTDTHDTPYADPYARTPEELQETLKLMKESNEKIYWHMFAQGFL